MLLFKTHWLALKILSLSPRVLQRMQMLNITAACWTKTPCSWRKTRVEDKGKTAHDRRTCITTKWRDLMAGVQHFICLITNNLDGENMEHYITCKGPFSGQNLAGVAMAVSWLAHNTSEVDDLKIVNRLFKPVTWAINAMCLNNAEIMMAWQSWLANETQKVLNPLPVTILSCKTYH